MQTIGHRIKLLRKEKKLTQKQLAQELDCSENQVMYWEKDRHCPSAVMLIVLSDYFEVTTDYILKGGKR